MSKLDKSKPKMSLLYSSALFEMARVREKALEKYPNKEDWRSTKDIRHYDAAFRHIFASMNGEIKDPESGFDHLAHAMCNLMFLIEKRTDSEAGLFSVNIDEVISPLKI